MFCSRYTSRYMNPRAQGRPITFNVARLVSRRQGPIASLFRASVSLCLSTVCAPAWDLSLCTILSAARRRNRTCTNYLSHGQSLCVRAFRLGYTAVPKRVCRRHVFTRNFKRCTRRNSSTRAPTYTAIQHTTTSSVLMVY